MQEGYGSRFVCVCVGVCVCVCVDVCVCVCVCLFNHASCYISRLDLSAVKLLKTLSRYASCGFR